MSTKSARIHYYREGQVILVLHWLDLFRYIPELSVEKYTRVLMQTNFAVMIASTLQVGRD